MKKITLIIALCTISFTLNAQVNTYNIGDVVGDFTVTDTEGNEYTLYDITASGKYVYLDFFFDTCVPCQQTTPLFNEFHDKYGCNEGSLFMMSVNNGSDSDAEVIIFKDNFGGEFEHAPAISADGGSGAVDTAFGINAYPTFVLIGPDNTLVEADIWPINDLSTFENTIPAGANAEPMECSLAVGEVETLSFSMYPNPSTNGNVTIKLPNSTSGAMIVVHNILGQEAYRTTINPTTEVIQPLLKSGTYLVTVIADGVQATQSLIVR